MRTNGLGLEIAMVLCILSKTGPLYSNTEVIKEYIEFQLNDQLHCKCLCTHQLKHFRNYNVVGVAVIISNRSNSSSSIGHFSNADMQSN